MQTQTYTTQHPTFSGYNVEFDVEELKEEEKILQGKIKDMKNTENTLQKKIEQLEKMVQEDRLNILKVQNDFEDKKKQFSNDDNHKKESWKLNQECLHNPKFESVRNFLGKLASSLGVSVSELLNNPWTMGFKK